MLKQLLQGKPFGVPLHPVLVHFPIGLFVLSLIFDLVSVFSGDANGLVLGAFYTMALGVLMAFVAAVPGAADWSDIRADHPAQGRAMLHLLLSGVVLCLYVANLVIRMQLLDALWTPAVPLALSLIAMGTLAVSAYLGGTLIYEDGIAVGRARRPTPTPARTIRATAGPDGWAALATAELAEGHTLRAEVDGAVMTIARLDGRLHAFQEFCTHRYGPLSEGTLCDGQVECPWHGSRFDVQSGRVTRGPARTDLRTYEVREHNGVIEARVRAPVSATPPAEVARGLAHAPELQG